MNKFCLSIILGLFVLGIAPAHAAENESPETGEVCDPEDADCASEEEELERGFDPCLINAALPACNPDEKSGDSATTERAPSDTEGTDDSG